MHVFKQLLNWIPEMIIINDEKIDLGVGDVMKKQKTIFHLYMTLIIESILKK